MVLATQTKVFALIITVGLIAVIFPLRAMSALEDSVTMQNFGTVNYGTWRKVIWRTSHWLCTDPVYGINGNNSNAMPILVEKIHASIIMIYFKDSDIPSWQWANLKQSVDYWITQGKTVWLIIMKTTLNETDGTPYSIQYVIDTFKGKIAGVIFDAWNDVPPSEATQWLLEKKTQLANNGMQCGYYHGDGFSPNYGNPSTDVNATYLCEQGLISMAWLQDDNSWKPATFNLPRFWIDYDIITESEWGGPTGQSYAEIYNQWYLGNVIGKDHLKSNDGCESLIFMTYTATSWPNQDAIRGMVAAANDWLT
jgi:hypothetical protein